MFAWLSALGAHAGGTTGIAKAVKDASATKMQLSEDRRHNRKTEEITFGKGLHLIPYKKGLGLQIKPYKQGQEMKS